MYPIWGRVNPWSSDAPEGKQVGSLAQLKRFWIFLLFWMGFFNYLQMSIGMIHLPQRATIGVSPKCRIKAQYMEGRKKNVENDFLNLRVGQRCKI